MNFKKIVSAVAAAAIAVTTMAVSTFALDPAKYIKPEDFNKLGVNNMAFVLANQEGDPSLVADTGLDKTTIYGFTYNLTLESGEGWIGGGIGINSTSAGWKQFNTWGNAQEDIKFEAGKTEAAITYKSDSPLFTADDTYAMTWLAVYQGSVGYTITSIDLLDKDGAVIDTDSMAPAADAAPADDAATDDAAPADDAATDDAADDTATDDAADEVTTDDADADVVDDAEDADTVEETDIETDDAAADDTTAADDTAASDATTTSAGTGNATVAVIASVMAAAGAAAIASKKRK